MSTNGVQQYTRILCFEARGETDDEPPSLFYFSLPIKYFLPRNNSIRHIAASVAELPQLRGPYDVDAPRDVRAPGRVFMVSQIKKLNKSTSARVNLIGTEKQAYVGILKNQAYNIITTSSRMRLLSIKDYPFMPSRFLDHTVNPYLSPLPYSRAELQIMTTFMSAFRFEQTGPGRPPAYHTVDAHPVHIAAELHLLGRPLGQKLIRSCYGGDLNDDGRIPQAVIEMRNAINNGESASIMPKENFLKLTPAKDMGSLTENNLNVLLSSGWDVTPQGEITVAEYPAPNHVALAEEIVEDVTSPTGVMLKRCQDRLTINEQLLNIIKIAGPAGDKQGVGDAKVEELLNATMRRRKEDSSVEKKASYFSSLRITTYTYKDYHSHNRSFSEGHLMNDASPRLPLSPFSAPFSTGLAAMRSSHRILANDSNFTIPSLATSTVTAPPSRALLGDFNPSVPAATAAPTTTGPRLRSLGELMTDRALSYSSPHISMTAHSAARMMMDHNINNDSNINTSSSVSISNSDVSPSVEKMTEDVSSPDSKEHPSPALPSRVPPDSAIAVKHYIAAYNGVETLNTNSNIMGGDIYPMYGDTTFYYQTMDDGAASHYNPLDTTLSVASMSSASSFASSSSPSQAGSSDPADDCLPLDDIPLPSAHDNAKLQLVYLPSLDTVPSSHAVTFADPPVPSLPSLPSGAPFNEAVPSLIPADSLEILRHALGPQPLYRQSTTNTCLLDTLPSSMSSSTAPPSTNTITSSNPSSSLSSFITSNWVPVAGPPPQPPPRVTSSSLASTLASLFPSPSPSPSPSSSSSESKAYYDSKVQTYAHGLGTRRSYGDMVADDVSFTTAVASISNTSIATTPSTSSTSTAALVPPSLAITRSPEMWSSLHSSSSPSFVASYAASNDPSSEPPPKRRRYE